MKKIYLLLYYALATHLPMQPFPGFQLFYKFRYFLGKRILKNCGEKVVIKNKCYIGDGSKLSVGDYSQLGQNARFGGPISLGSYIMMGPDVVFMAVTHDVSDHSKPMVDHSNPSIEKEIIIDDNVWIGTRVIIMPGVKIGKNSIVGAGAVVTKSFPANSILGGVPARLIKTRAEWEE